METQTNQVPTDNIFDADMNIVSKGIIISVNYNDGNKPSRVRGILLGLNENEFLIWPIGNNMQDANMMVFPRQQTPFSVLGVASDTELFQAMDGLSSLQNNMSNRLATTPRREEEHLAEISNPSNKPVWK